jgi:starch synthase (maltosyl-transferring)
MQPGLEAPRIYNLFPTLLGGVELWEKQVPAIAEMGFNWIFLNPFHYPGFSGSLYAVKDYYRLHPILQGNSDRTPDELLSHFISTAGEAGIGVMMDLVVNHTSKDAELVAEHPDWYLRDAHGGLRSPFAEDLDDPSRVTVWEDLAQLDYSDRPERAEMLAYWNALVAHYVGLGIRGFRCDAAYQVPGVIWKTLIDTAHEDDSRLEFFAETLGAPIDAVAQLHSAGFHYFFNSAKWWDFRADWLLDQYEQFRHIAPSIAFPESHDTERLTAETGGGERESRFRYLFAACFSSGVMMPIGYELGFERQLHVVKTTSADWEEPKFDISGFIREVNLMKSHNPVLEEEGPQTRVTAPDEPLVGLLRRSERGSRRAFTLINPDLEHGHDFGYTRLAQVLQTSPDAIREVTPEHRVRDSDAETESFRIEPRSIRVFAAD